VTVDAFRFPPVEIPPDLAPLRREVRAFLAEHSRNWSGRTLAHSWTGFDRAFSLEVARSGWIGMTWPKRYGGAERSALERYVVIEEMLAAGAPLGAHWFGERQSGPLILRLGTEGQRERFLPAIVRGEISFCIGLSEPGAGSDLASLRSRATAVEGGWRLNGRKIWTTNAQHCQFMIGLFRTAGTAEIDRHQGLSQFLLDLSAPGIQIRPIRDLTAGEHFNEVTFDDVFVSRDLLIGTENAGWAQANAELAFERSQPDRYMSCFPLLPLAIDAVNAAGGGDRLAARRIGQAAAELAVLREMSLSIMGQLAGGHAPAQEAALVKDMGNSYEQSMPDLVRELTDAPPTLYPADVQSELLATLTLIVPTFSLRGGTREILRGIIAKGLGLR
jgi:alkylation response protein AidB-like acyl-CoA dehydrogenase